MSQRTMRVPKTKGLNVDKGKGVAILEHKDKYIEERRQDLIDDDGSWVKVASKVNHRRHQKEKVHEHYGQERVAPLKVLWGCLMHLIMIN